MSENRLTSEEPRKGNRIKYVVFGICVIGIFVYLFIHSIHKRNELAEAAEQASAPRVPGVRVVKPKLASDTAVLFLPGNIEGYRETLLNARVAGYIRKWYVDIGDQVHEGQLLAELETPELDQQLAQARATQDLTSSSLQRVNSVNIEGAVSVQQKANLEGAQKEAVAMVSQLEAQKSFKRVTAPFAGVITSRNIDIGTLVNAGSGASQQLFTISQIDKLRIFVNVPQSFISNIKVGSTARIIVQEMTVAPLTGKVTRTAGALNPDTRTLLVQVEFDNPGHLYLPGMYAQVKFVIRRTNRALIIPANTLVIRTNGPQVVTVTPQNTIALKNVTIGKDNGATIEIADGLKGDEQLVINSSLDLTEGLKVSIQK